MKKTSLLAMLFCCVFVMHAQVKEESSWKLGISAGYHGSFMQISDLNKEIYPSKKMLQSGLFSIFVQKSFGQDYNFAIRPEIAFLNRGGSLTNIMSEHPGYWEEHNIVNYDYNVTAHYFDIRCPIMYRFGTRNSAIRPYAYIAPILSLATGGRISKNINYYDPQNHTSSEVSNTIDITKANMASALFNGAIGVGVDWQFKVDRHVFSVGLEAMYEQSFTNTYGKDKEAIDRLPLVEDLASATALISSRRFRGLEIKVNVGIPFSVFQKIVEVFHEPEIVYVEAEPAPAPEPQIIYIEKEPEPVEEKPCYSLEEIIDMMTAGQSVYGKTICAIDDAINFDTGKSTIKPESYEYLNLLAKTLIRTNARILVKGHTDNVGGDDYNMNLSRDRANSVKAYLESRGVPSSKLSVSYYGKTMPLTSNATEEGRRLNRRVEFEILTQ